MLTAADTTMYDAGKLPKGSNMFSRHYNSGGKIINKHKNCNKNEGFKTTCQVSQGIRY